MSLLAGSFIFGIDYRAPYIVTAVFFFVGYAFVSEIDFDCNQYSGPVRGGRKVYFDTLKKSFALLKDRNIFFILFLSSIFNAATMATFDMIQIALKRVSIPSKFFRTVYFGFIIISALGTRFAYLIQEKFSKSWKTQTISLVLFQAIAIALLSFVEKSAIGVLLVFAFLEFMNGLMIIFFDSLNKLVVDNSIRMTMSSFQALSYCKSLERRETSARTLSRVLSSRF